MYNNFYYAELLILIPLVPLAFFLFVASYKELAGDLRFLSLMISVLLGALFLAMMFTLGASLPNSPSTKQAVEFLRKADENDVDVTYFNMYSKIKYRGRVVFPYAVRRPVINYLEQQEKAQANELIKEVIFD